MKALAVIAIVLIAVALVRLRLSFSLDQTLEKSEQTRLTLFIGPIPVRILPGRPKRQPNAETENRENEKKEERERKKAKKAAAKESRKAKKEKREARRRERAQRSYEKAAARAARRGRPIPDPPAAPEQKPQKRSLPVGLHDIKTLLGILVKTLSSLRRRILIRRLSVQYLVAGTDPFDTVSAYNTVNAALPSVIRLLHACFRVGKDDYRLSLSFAHDAPLMRVSAEVQLRIGQIFAVLFGFLGRAIAWTVPWYLNKHPIRLFCRIARLLHSPARDRAGDKDQNAA